LVGIDERPLSPLRRAHGADRGRVGKTVPAVPLRALSASPSGDHHARDRRGPLSAGAEGEWAQGRYALVAGFVDNGESLEGCVRREVKEEVGVDVTDIRYVGSQNWPFPSQLMVGFVATYTGGEITLAPDELEDARWFDRGNLPGLPSRHSISRFIIDHYGTADIGGPGSTVPRR